MRGPRTPLLLFALATAQAARPVTPRLLMNYDLGPVGSGPLPCAAVLSGHAGDAPTAVVGQFLNEPMGVQAFNASLGPSAPIWSLWPETTNIDTVWQAAGTPALTATGAVDTVLLQYSAHQFDKAPRPCIFSGMASTGAGAASATPVWTYSVPDCIPGIQANIDYMGYWQDVALTPDGATVVAVLLVSGQETLLGLNAADGAVLYSAPAHGGSYGVQPTADSRYFLSAVDNSSGRFAFVYDARTGAQRGPKGCGAVWNNAPAISPDGAFIITGDQNGLFVCKYYAGERGYDKYADVAIPAKGQQYWFPLSMAIVNITGADGVVRHVGGASFFANTPQGARDSGNAGSIGRFYAIDLEASSDAAADFILIDHIQDTNKRGLAWSLAKAAGDYFVLGSMGGDGNVTEPNLYVYEAGVPGAPALAPIYQATEPGYTLDMDVMLVGAMGAKGEAVIQVISANGGEDGSGSGGNGGNAVWVELSVGAAA